MTSQPISDFMLEAYVSGDLSDTQMKELHVLIQNDTTLQAQVEFLKRDSEIFLDRYPASGVLTEVERRLKQLPSTQPHKDVTSSLRRLSLALGGGLCALLIFTLLPNPPTPSDNGIRTKGVSPGLAIYDVGNQDQSRLLKSDAFITQGTTLQVSITNAQDVYAWVISIDGRGSLTSHFPRDGESSLISSAKFRLNASYTLDDAPIHETFILVTAQEPLDTQLSLNQLKSISTANEAIEKIQSQCPDCIIYTHRLLK